MIVKKREELSVGMINAIPYTDFVGLVNQWNVLPGAFVSLSKWATFSDLNAQSYILEVACTTGFSSRELAKMTGCRGKAFDLSAKSIENAQYNAQRYAPNTHIEYTVDDGYEFNSSELFSHIVIGASLRFFPDPSKMMKKVISLLQPGGYILANEFYVTKDIPAEIIALASRTFGITPTTQPYKEVMKIYKGLDIFYEDDCVIRQETDEELIHYTESTITRACAMLDIEVGGQLYTAMYERLLSIKHVSNILRPYQRYVTLVLKYSKDTYPNRYVELF